MQLGIPPSQLDGREPAETTEYEYDDEGQLVRAVTVRDSRWTEQDRAEVLALRMYRDSLCPCGCGHPVAETTAFEGEGPVFVAERVACNARLALIEAQEAAKPQTESGRVRAGARLWSIRKLNR